MKNVLASKGQQIRHTVTRSNANVFSALAKEEIATAAELYCGAVNNGENSKVYDECVVRLYRNFPMIGVIPKRTGQGFEMPEIREAFSMAALGHIDAKLEAYGGRFTVTLFVRVLTAYIDWRNTILHAISKAQDVLDEEDKQEQAKEKNEQARVQILDDFERLKISNDRFKLPDQIPLAWVRVLQGAGLFERIDKGEAASRWIWAKTHIVQQFINEMKIYIISPEADRPNKKPALLLTEKECRALYEKCLADEDYFPDELRESAKNLYGRITIFSKLAPYKGA